MNRWTRRAGGFTLSEMLMVVALLIILLSMAWPMVRSTQWHAQNSQCATNLRRLTVGFTSYSMDNFRYWPWRKYNNGQLTQFQRGYPPRPEWNTDEQVWSTRHQKMVPKNDAWSMVPILSPYFPFTLPDSYPGRQTITTDPKTGEKISLGTEFVCPMYEPVIGYHPTVPGWSGRAKYGTHTGGLADTNGGGNNNHFMSYSYFAFAFNWREMHKYTRRLGDPITFGIRWPSHDWADPVLPRSMILLSDSVQIAGTNNVRVIHKPPPWGPMTYDSGSHLSPSEGWLAYGEFTTNHAYQDGSVRTVTADARGAKTGNGPLYDDYVQGNQVYIPRED